MAMNSNLLEAVQQHLTPDTMRQIGASLGTDPGTASNAVSMALPVILGGLATNASNPQGASALNQALDAHDGSILDNLGGLLGSGAMSGIGGAILGHIFGKKQAPVQDGVSKATGLSSQQVAQLLMMLAPIVMGALGRMKQQQGLDHTQLPNVLQQSTAGQAGLHGVLADIFRR